MNEGSGPGGPLFLFVITLHLPRPRTAVYHFAMRYDLESLGPERFQELCQALIVAVHPRAQAFPVAQPDGGRDIVVWVGEDTQAVYQIKFVRNPLSTHEPHKWLESVVAAEAPKVARLLDRGAKEYFLVTNVPGTAHLDHGSIDRVREILRARITIPSHCWWRDDIERRIDATPSIRWSFPSILVAGDLLSILDKSVERVSAGEKGTLKAFLAEELSRESDVRFKQANLQQGIFDLFIDVPFARERGTFVFEPDEISSSVAGAATHLLRWPIGAVPEIILIEGGPGQGKSTTTQFICQLHRARLLNRTEMLEQVSPSLLNAPIRLPLKIDLRDLASWISGGDPFEYEPSSMGLSRSIEGYLVGLIRDRSGGSSFTVESLRAAIAESPPILVFDGLDEVADRKIRARCVEEIKRTATRLRESAPSLFTIVTSRPMSLPANTSRGGDFLRMPLGHVTRAMAVEYAERWTKARGLSKADTQTIKNFFGIKLDEPHIVELAKNPMQLAILLSLVHVKGSSLPDKRTALYDTYVEVFFSREAEKSEIVRANYELLREIHGYCALQMHSRAETNRSTGRISERDLRTMLYEYLRREEHDTSLVDDLLQGVVERVVALVSRIEGTFEFEVQPLREYFAARHLYDTAPYSPAGDEKSDTRTDRFEAMMQNPHWFNVLRFYAGCYSKGELSSILDGLQAAADASPANSVLPRSLASTLLGDWVFSQHRRLVKEVVEFTLDRGTFPHLLALWQRSSAEGALRLPEKFGGDLVAKAVLDLIRMQAGADYQAAAIRVARKNCSFADVEREFVAGFDRADTAEEREAIAVASVYFGLGSKFLPEVISHDAATVSSEVLRAFVKAGKAHLLEKSHPNLVPSCLQIAVNSPMDGTQIRSGTTGIVAAVSWAWAMIPDEFSIDAFRSPVPMERLVLQRRRRGLHIGDVDGVSVFGSDFSGRTEELTKVIVSELQKDGAEWSTSLEPWRAVVQTGRRVTADGWVWWYLASLASGIRNGGERGRVDSDGSDGACVDFCRKVRMDSGRGDLLKHCVQHGGHARVAAVLIALLTYRNDHIERNAVMLESSIDSMSDSEWTGLSWALRRHLGAFRKGKVALPWDFRKCSDRILGVFLAARGMEDSLIRELRRRLRSNDGLSADPSIHWWLQNALVESMVRQPRGFNEATLEDLSRSYSSVGPVAEWLVDFWPGFPFHGGRSESVEARPLDFPLLVASMGNEERFAKMAEGAKALAEMIPLAFH